MKKIWIHAFSLGVFAVCCMLGITVYAQTNISSAQVTLEKTSYTYSGEAVIPKETVSVAGEDMSVKTLAKDVDYSVSYSKNKNAGTATVKITGKGEYSGTVSTKFTITPAEISKARYVRSVNATTTSAPYYYVEYNGKELKEGADYTLKISSLEKCGVDKATVTFTGLGNFTGERTGKINVYPGKVSNLKESNIYDKSFTLSWDSQSSSKVSGYKVYSCNPDGSNKKSIKTISSASLKLTSSPATVNYYVVRSYVKSGGKTLYGEYSDVISACTKPSAVVLNSVTKSKKSGKVSVKWQKIKCTGYEIQYTTDKKFKSKVKKATAGSDKTGKSFDVGGSKTYYARVRAYYENNGKKYYGSWSSKLSSSYSKVYASYSTNYVNKPKRTTNLRLACKAINGTVIQPGETFSFNKIVGERTAKKGYKEATIFTGSESTAESLGGGVCQVASTIFNAALLGNLQIVERHQHSQRVTYCPLGRDAAIYWGSEDFKFKNNTDYPIKMEMKCANGKVSCTLKVSYDTKPKKVKLSVKRSGKNFTLKRTVSGKTNYTAHSKY